VKTKLNIREAQKALTRQRILDAARELFYRQGFYSTSVDQIALEAGASRPTFYLHFRDKDEVLSQIAEEYLASLQICAERLPGPRPSLDEIRSWMREQAEFLRREKMSFSIVSEVGAQEVISPIYSRRILTTWTEALARRAPSFATAMRRDARGTEARAFVELISLEIAWATASAVLHKNTKFAEVAIELVSQRLFDFLHDPRYADAGPAPPPAAGRRVRSQTPSRD
jgi:AcrR family transcriptional regulator